MYTCIWSDLYVLRLGNIRTPRYGILRGENETKIPLRDVALQLLYLSSLAA